MRVQYKSVLYHRSRFTPFTNSFVVSEVVNLPNQQAYFVLTLQHGRSQIFEEPLCRPHVVLFPKWF